ncbi:MAG: mycofactocin-coupled SDR family oxidoreductase [Actinomycetales bacterium]
MGKLEGKVALVTGAARGQGRSHAVAMAAEGADIIAVDVCADIPAAAAYYSGPREEDLAETVSLVEGEGRKAVSGVADVRDAAALTSIIDSGVSALGGLDIVVANAGIFVFGTPTHEVTEAEWDEVIGINVKGVWLTCKAAIPHLLAQGKGGSIVITSSAAGVKGTPNVAPYTVSKHAVVGLMRTLAVELGPHSIRVNTVHPTGVSTPMILNDALYQLFVPDVDHPTREQAEPGLTSGNAIPVPWVDSADVSHAVVYLASDDARYVTGTELRVDAGFLVK